MKPIVFMLTACCALPAFSGDEGFSGFIGLQGGSKTQSVKYEAGIASARGQDGGFRVPIVGLSVARARQTGQTDFRLHPLGIGYDQPVGLGVQLQIEASPIFSFGGMTGPGNGMDWYAGIRYHDVSVGYYYWRVTGRKNPWDGREEANEGGVSLRMMF